MPEDDLVTRIVGQVVDEQGIPIANVPVTYMIARTTSRFSPAREVMTQEDGTFEIFTRYAARCNFIDVNGYLDNWQESRFPLTEGELSTRYTGSVVTLPGDVTDVDLLDVPIILEPVAELKVVPYDTIIDYFRAVELMGGFEDVLRDCVWNLSTPVTEEVTLRFRLGERVGLVRQYQDSLREVVDTITIDQVYQEVVL